MGGKTIPEAYNIFRSEPSNIKSSEMGFNDSYYKDLDTDREKGCIRSINNAYNKDGGLAVLYGNIARDGGIIKTAGVDSSLFKCIGPARVFDCQEDAVESILNGSVRKGDVVVIRFEGPRGGPGMQEMLYPTSYLKSKDLDKKCALITDGRFSGGTSGLSVGHISPEAAAKGALALIQTGDAIEIDIKNRRINVLVPEEELIRRKNEEELLGNLSYKPKNRKRIIPSSLRAYAAHVSSADLGAVRLI
jgi:dihydroxy-acid dehydratase